MKLRRCGGCGETKAVTEFNWRRVDRGQRDNLCRPCRAEYHRGHYLANNARYVRQARDRKRALAEERTAFLIDFFRSHPCRDCGESDPLVLEFDHLDDKAFNIGRDLPYRNWESVLAEIAKCEVVCANCHRRRTARRARSTRCRLVDDG